MLLYSATLLDHFQNPRNAGELPSPAIVVDASNPACGDIMRLSLLIADRTIADARFKTRGCTAAIACGSALTELVKSKSVEDAARITPAEVTAAVDGLPPASSHAAILAVDALRQALKAAK